MGKRGPAPTPTAIKKRRGTYRPDRDNRREPTPDVAAPECPDWLSEEARAEWDRLVPHLVALRVLARTDLAMLAAYCDAWAKWVQATRAVDERGELVEEVGENGYRQQIPEVAVAEKYFRTLEKCAARFGLTPSDRTRVEVAPLSSLTQGSDSAGVMFGEPEKENPFAEFVGPPRGAEEG